MIENGEWKMMTRKRLCSGEFQASKGEALVGAEGLQRPMGHRAPQMAQLVSSELRGTAMPRPA